MVKGSFEKSRNDVCAAGVAQVGNAGDLEVEATVVDRF